ncbi:MAG: hypothetical protein AAF502_11045, partial [Bacteroidota bacterium]
TILPREKSTALRPPPGGEGNWLLDIGYYGTSSLALLLQEKGADCSTLVFTIPFCWLFSFGRNGLDFLLRAFTTHIPDYSPSGEEYCFTSPSWRRRELVA